MRRLLVLGLILTLGACARAGGGADPQVASAQSGGPAPSATATATMDPDAPLKFSRCMREHGITWFPDPDSSGRMAIRVPSSQDQKKFDAAQEACREFAPDRQAGPPPSAEDMAKIREFSKCMREHGVPDFPDPQPNGGIRFDSKDGGGPGDPTFDKAQQACDNLMPRRDEKKAGKA